jgi:transcription antitermination factor NusG
MTYNRHFMKRVNENPPARFPERPIDQAEALWWVAKIKPRQEKAVAADFINKNIEYYLPLITKITRRKDNNKPRKSILPLFAGYISLNTKKEVLRDIWSTGRIVSVIEIRHQKHFMEQLTQIYNILEKGIALEPCLESFPEGTPVCIQSGPLRGIKGVVSKVYNQNKLMLSVEGLGQAVLAVDAVLVKAL